MSDVSVTCRPGGRRLELDLLYLTPCCCLLVLTPTLLSASMQTPSPAAYPIMYIASEFGSWAFTTKIGPYCKPSTISRATHSPTLQHPDSNLAEYWAPSVLIDFSGNSAPSQESLSTSQDQTPQKVITLASLSVVICLWFITSALTDGKAFPGL